MIEVNSENAGEIGRTIKGSAVNSPSTVRRSATIALLASAMVKVQTDVEDPTKNKQADAGRKGTYRYADLPTVLDAVRPVLVKHGLSVMQFPCEFGDQPALTTIVLHTSGEWLETTMKLRASDSSPQSVGSALTYARRYALLSLCGVAADDDDDGKAGGTKPAQQPRQEAPKATMAQQCIGAIRQCRNRDQATPIWNQFNADVEAGLFTDEEEVAINAEWDAFGKRFPKPAAK